MASARSKRTYIKGWDGCGLLPIRNGRRITARLDRHFKINHRLAFPSCPRMDPQIHGPGSYMLSVTYMRVKGNVFFFLLFYCLKFINFGQDRDTQLSTALNPNTYSGATTSFKCAFLFHVNCNN